MKFGRILKPVLLALGNCVLILNLYFPLYNLEWKFFVGTNGA